MQIRPDLGRDISSARLRSETLPAVARARAAIRVALADGRATRDGAVAARARAAVTADTAQALGRVLAGVTRGSEARAAVRGRALVAHRGQAGDTRRARAALQVIGARLEFANRVHARAEAAVAVARAALADAAARARFVRLTDAAAARAAGRGLVLRRALRTFLSTELAAEPAIHVGALHLAGFAVIGPPAAATAEWTSGDREREAKRGQSQREADSHVLSG